MFWVRRTGSGDLRPLHLALDVRCTHQMAVAPSHRARHILAENGIITERCLPRELVESAENRDGAALSLASVERQHILKMLEFHGGNRQQTADTLGISRKTLYRKLTEYAID